MGRYDLEMARLDGAHATVRPRASSTTAKRFYSASHPDGLNDPTDSSVDVFSAESSHVNTPKHSCRGSFSGNSQAELHRLLQNPESLPQQAASVPEQTRLPRTAPIKTNMQAESTINKMAPETNAQPSYLTVRIDTSPDRGKRTGNGAYKKSSARAATNGTALDRTISASSVNIDQALLNEDRNARLFTLYSQNPIRAKIALVFEDPASSRIALVVNVVICLLIVFSAIITAIETIPEINMEGHAVVWYSICFLDATILRRARY